MFCWVKWDSVSEYLWTKWIEIKFTKSQKWFARLLKSLIWNHLSLCSREQSQMRPLYPLLHFSCLSFNKKVCLPYFAKFSRKCISTISSRQHNENVCAKPPKHIQKLLFQTEISSHNSAQTTSGTDYLRKNSGNFINNSKPKCHHLQDGQQNNLKNYLRWWFTYKHAL